MDTTILLIAASLVLAGILISPLSTRLGMPALLLFLGVGMLAGEGGVGEIHFDNVDAVFLVGNLALAVILLDGGMRTRVESFRVGLKPALLLATVGVVVTALICGVTAAWLLEIPLIEGLLIGAIISSTDAAAVFSLLQGRGLNLNERVEATLEIESGSNDPMAVFLTLLLIELMQNPAAGSVWSGVVMLIQQFGLGLVLGLAGGRVMAFLLDRVVLVTAMYPLLVASAGIALFSGTNYLGGSGFLAIYLMGVVLAGHRSPRMTTILQIHDGLAWLAQLVLFLLLGLLVTPSQLLDFAPMGLAISLVLIVLARPLSTFISLLPFGFSAKEHFFISWVGLRGAVPIVLALFPLMAGLANAGMIFQVTFVVVLVSLLLQGSTLATLARKLKLEVPGRHDPKMRIPLEAAEAAEHELLMFPLKGTRWAARPDITDLHLPDPARIVACFRDGKLFERRRGFRVQENDMLVVLAHFNQAGDVGRILGWEEPPERLTDRRFFGEFTVRGDALLGDVQAMYSVKVDRFASHMTLSQCFAQAHRGHPVVGDRLDLGSILLVVREVAGDQVTKVGLKLSRDL